MNDEAPRAGRSANMTGGTSVATRPAVASILRDVLSRVVWVREQLEDGDCGGALIALDGLEEDLLRELNGTGVSAAESRP